MIPFIQHPSLDLQKIAAEGDVHFLLARLNRHAPHLYKHSLRVAGLFELLWSDVDLAPETRNKVLRSALLHDIGCIHIPKEELDEAPKDHTKIGVNMLASMIQEGRIDEEMILYHHENMDGTGFPFAVNWTKLSPFVRSLRIVDSFDWWAGGLYTELAVHVAMEDLFQWSGVIFDEQWLDRFNHVITDVIRTNPMHLDEISRL